MRSKLSNGLMVLVALCSSAAPLAEAQVGRISCRDSADSGTTTCRIDQPFVDQSAELGRAYPTVIFRPGDLVTVTAGGCVQTGGHFKTWKRYVNPSGRDSDRLYHGTITIPGVTPPGFPVPIAQIKQYAIPNGVAPPNNVLVLGYKDEHGAYGDNGYYSHDDGDDDQCKEGPGRDGGPAWVVVKIEHGRSGFLPSVPAPFDIVSDTVDSNGLPLNPKWGWEANPASRRPPYSNGKQLATASEPDPAQLCDGFQYIDDTHGHIRLGSPPCSTQIGADSIDIPSGSNDAACAAFGPGGNRLHGHVNWWPATVSGVIAWAGHETGIRPTTQSSHWYVNGDDDYCFYLYPHNNSLLTFVRPNFIEAEMDSDETVDDFGSEWWTSFHKAVDDSSGLGTGVTDFPWGDTAPSQMISWKEATITGLVNVDQEHDGHSELHPIYAMAIQLNASSEHPTGDPNDDRWAVFARNWGNEGYCSQDQHYWDVSQVSIFIPEPVPSSDYSLVEPLDLIGNKNAVMEHGKVPGGLVLKFDLGTPDSKTMVDGSVHIKWVPMQQGRNNAALVLNRPRSPMGPTAPTPQMIAAGRAVRPEEVQPDLMTGLSDEEIEKVSQQLESSRTRGNSVRLQARRVDFPAELAPHPAANSVRPRVRVEYDAVRGDKLRHQWQVLCAAHNNQIPSLPNACTNLAAPPIRRHP